MSFPWLEVQIPMNKRVLTKWLHSGVIERGGLFPTTSGVPQGGIASPVIGHMVLDGLEAGVTGLPRFRRVHNLNYVRYADDFSVTANNREVLAETIIPRIQAFLAERGVTLSADKTRITPLSEGFDFLGQTIRKYERPNGKPAKLQITPSQASLPAVKATIKVLCRSARGTPPAHLIAILPPVLRGWANYHRHSICAETFRKLDNYVWHRVYRWARRRHGNKAGRWLAARYFPHKPGETWRCTDPVTGAILPRVSEVVKPQRHIKGKAQASPFALEGESDFHHRDKQVAATSTTAFKGQVLRRHQGRCLGCQQVIQAEEQLERHHRDGQHQNNRLSNLVLLHPTCHRQVPSTPKRQSHCRVLPEGVGHA
jgi:RNA-directed DNA polymerase